MIDMNDEAARMGFEAALAHAPTLKAKEVFAYLKREPPWIPAAPEASLAALRERFGKRADNPGSKPRRAFDTAWRVTFRLLGTPLDLDALLSVKRVRDVMVEEARKRLPKAVRELRRDYA